MSSHFPSFPSKGESRRAAGSDMEACPRGLTLNLSVGGTGSNSGLVGKYCLIIDPFAKSCPGFAKQVVTAYNKLTD